MARYWIFDRDNTPQGHPLQKLFRRIQQVLGEHDSKIHLMRSEGYGEMIQTWEGQLEHQDKIATFHQEFDRISSGTEEWFYNVTASYTSPGGMVIFGLHDSSALFIDTTPALAQKITKIFTQVRTESSQQ